MKHFVRQITMQIRTQIRELHRHSFLSDTILHCNDLVGRILVSYNARHKVLLFVDVLSYDTAMITQIARNVNYFRFAFAIAITAGKSTPATGQTIQLIFQSMVIKL